jgi:hypothetical protein
MMITLFQFERDWGFVASCIPRYKFELLPRLTITAVTDMFGITLGFLCFELQIGLWSKKMREFNRRSHDTE